MFSIPSSGVSARFFPGTARGVLAETVVEPEGFGCADTGAVAFFAAGLGAALSALAMTSHFLTSWFAASRVPARKAILSALGPP